MISRSRNPRWLLPAALMSASALLATSCSSGDTTDEAASTPTQGSNEGTSGGASKEEGIKLGVLGECKGPFGGFHEDTVSGVALALKEYAGATINSKTTSLKGWEGAEVNGTPIELVGIGCGDDTADTISDEIRQLVEQEGANVVIGPLSGDEGIAVAEYAKSHPELTVLSGIAGSQEPTLQVQAPNFFRFHGDGAIWNAGMGDILHNQEGWDTVAVIADDYSFGHTSAAGFIADFCGVGGEVTSRVFPPLGTTDYSSFVQQLPDPDEVDGYFWVVGGTGTQAALEAFVNAKGELTGDQHAGNLFFNPSLAQALGTDIAGAYVGGFAVLPGDIQTPEVKEYLASADDTWTTLASGITGGEPGEPSAAASFGFMYGYYSAGVALAQALEETGGDPAPDVLQPTLAELTLELPYGDISLDENRSGIVDVGLSQLVEENGEIVQKAVAIIPDVDQTFGGTFSTDTPAPGRDFPPCEERDLPWVGNAIPVENGVPQE
uniref:ABC transporter, substrate-binding protein (Cluster 4, leucine/isoleucine/valine/benzoate) n=1 Tax=uncultured Nocardioidaceae bacterium TaxID=253824 RepID=A0A6J4M9R5_9ACTN|nr:MAG: ABC transporter, substrate-binding protein (cluster 4, leucine/isoleucine/valine/benzoate) [uncultured Nocardioidaceae bacterium]